MVPMSGPRWGEAGVVGKADSTQRRLEQSAAGSAALGAGGVGLVGLGQARIKDAGERDARAVAPLDAAKTARRREIAVHAGAKRKAGEAARRFHEERADLGRAFVPTAATPRGESRAVVRSVKLRGGKTRVFSSDRMAHTDWEDLDSHKDWLRDQVVESRRARKTSGEALKESQGAYQEAKAARGAFVHTAPKTAARWKVPMRAGKVAAVAGAVGAAGSVAGIERHRARQVPAGNAVGRAPGSGAQARAARVAAAAAEGDRYRAMGR